MDRHYIVEICPIDHKQSKKIKEYHEELGYQVYAHRGHYLLILGGDRVWRHEDTIFSVVRSGVYVFKD